MGHEAPFFIQKREVWSPWCKFHQLLKEAWSHDLHGPKATTQEVDEKGISGRENWIRLVISQKIAASDKEAMSTFHDVKSSLEL